MPTSVGTNPGVAVSEIEGDRAADVVVAGAGPAGLMVAGDLAEAGVDVVVTERRTAEQSNLTRAFVVAPRTLEQLDARGVADELVGAGSRLTEMRLYRRIRVDFSVLATRFPFELIVPQYETEAVLRRRAERAGVRFAWRTEVTGVDQDAGGVVVHTTGGRWRARYLVGADGVHSTVRRAVGAAFPGEVVVPSMMLADVRFTERPADELRADANRDGFAFHVPFGDGWYRVICWNRHRERPADAPVDLDEVRAMLRSVHGTDYGLSTARWLSRFRCDERQVENYRVGRVLLVGDAAHTHTPAGAQGMNTGLQDAANLGWRLAAAVHGHVLDVEPGDVLDGYHRERHPVGRTVIRGSSALMTVARTGSPWLRGLRSAMLGGVTGRRPVPMPVARAVAGIGLDYPAPRGAARPVGRRVPDLALRDGTRLYEQLRHRRFVFLHGGGRGGAGPRPGGRMPVHEVTAASPSGTDLLVRPDGHIAWAG